MKEYQVQFWMFIHINRNSVGDANLPGVYGHEQAHVQMMLAAINDQTLQSQYLADLRMWESNCKNGVCSYKSMEDCRVKEFEKTQLLAETIGRFLYFKGYAHDNDPTTGHPPDGEDVPPIGGVLPVRRAIRPSRRTRIFPPSPAEVYTFFTGTNHLRACVSGSWLGPGGTEVDMWHTIPRDRPPGEDWVPGRGPAKKR